MAASSAGTLTLIWRADGLAEFWPRWTSASATLRCCRFTAAPDAPAIRVLVRARKGSRAPLALLPGLMLNDETGKPTAEAEAVLRGARGAAGWLAIENSRRTAGADAP